MPDRAHCMLALALLSACASSPSASPEGGTAAAGMPGKAVEPPTMGPQARVLCENLEVPWGLDFLPDGALLVSERAGRISRVDAVTGERQTWASRDAVDVGEGGLLGLAVDPAYAENGWVYVYETSATSNRILRLRTVKGSPRLVEDKVILDNIPKARFHNGGVLRFGPDGMLYAGTGDARDPQRAQDPADLAGKILRMTRDGHGAPGNPYAGDAVSGDEGSGDQDLALVYSLGHRNVQGLAWDASGQLWASEHGPSGEINGWCCHDEVNRITAGANYGWPHVIGDDRHSGTLPPAAHSGMDTWAPGGCAFLGPAWGSEAGQLVVAGLRGRRMLRFQAGEQGLAERDPWLQERFGRLRNVVAAPDGSLYVLTSNRDGRGRSVKGDDRIVRLRPKAGN